MTDAANATTTTTTQATNTTTAVAADAWMNSLDDETKGYLQNKGLAQKPVSDVITSISKFHREAEKLIGAPATDLIRLPKDPAAPEWSQVYKRLGALNSPEEYKLDGVKHAGDKPISEGLANTLRKAAHGAHLSNDAANAIARDVVAHLDSQEANRAADEATKTATERTALKSNWGANEAANMITARAAANALGVAPEAVTALEKVVGYAKVMEMFRQIGSKIGEDRFVQSRGGTQGTAMSKEQATDEITNLKNDQVWVKKYLAGGMEEKRKLEALQRIVSGTTA